VLHAADAKWKSNMWLGATVQADLIDLPPLTAMTLSKGGVVTQHFIVGGSATPTLAWTGDGGLIELPAVQATTLTWKGGMLRTPKLSTTGKTTLDTAGTDIGAWLAGGDVVSTDGAPETDTLNLTGNLALKGKSQFIVRKEQAKISGALTLSDTAQLRAVGGASSPRLVVSAKTVDVAKGAAIHADLAGPKFADLPGYVAENGSGYTGGSHGGTGRAISGTAQSTFGDVRLPNTPGGAGPKGALGGGVVIVNASQRFTHHGRLSANGQSYGYGGGAGGSVRVHTPELHGAGFIEALGGTGGKSGGGGGGGRVALYVSSVLGGNFQPSTWSTGIRTWGGLSSAVSSGAGTLFVMRKGSVHGDLVVQAQSLTYTSVASRAVVLPETKVLAVKGSKLTSAKVLHADRFGGGLLNVKVDPKVGPGSVTPFGIASNDQTSLTLQDPKSTLAKHTAIGATLRSLYVFDHLHMGGGATWDASGADVLITSGALLSSDKTVFTGQGGVRAERLVLAGVKKLVFSGGETTLGPLTTAAGEGLAIDILGGTVHLGSRTIASLNISGGAKVTGANLAVKGAAKIDASTATIGQLRVSGDLTTTGKTTLSITDDILEVDGMLTLGKSGVLTIPTGYKDKQVKRLLVTAGSVILQPTSIVDLNYRGYPVNTTLYPESKYLPGNRAGGCHAGRGVISSTSSAYCTTFDDPTWPVWPGGGGGVGANGNGHGGGVVHFTVAGNMAIQGTIRANGQSNAYSGPGAGGSIAITAKSVSGFGSVQAHGGGGGSVCVKYRKTYPYNCILYYRSGGGGGGMIAIVDTAAMADGFAHAALHKHAVAYGGGRWDGWRGGHGTVYVRQSGKKYGDLLVRGTPSLKSVWPTVLTMVPEGNVVSAGPKTINNPGTFLAGVWAGQFVSVHVNEGAPRPLDNSVARVVANTIDTLTFLTSFDISKVTGIGKNYRGILHLDSLDIADYGKLSVTGDLVIHGGDRTWNDSKKFALGTGSTLAGQNIDFAGNNKTDTKMTGVTVGKPLGRVYCTDCGASGLILQ
ncbi:MAG: hypothetical protein KC502_19790, partial [Myxococcales bacterium]|nr:hypothetical protein [Myxococcales bacterium]